MPFSIDAFKASVTKGFQRGSHFTALVTPGRAMGANFFPTELRCETAPISGRSVVTHERHHYGPVQQMGYNQSFQPARLTFLCETGLPEKMWFEEWQDYCVGIARGLNGPQPGMYDIGYYDDYVGQIDITSYDDNGFATHHQTLVEAWPSTVDDIEMSWDNDDFVRLGVTFHFKYYINDPELYSTAPEDSEPTV